MSKPSLSGPMLALTGLLALGCTLQPVPSALPSPANGSAPPMKSSETDPALLSLPFSEPERLSPVSREGRTVEVALTAQVRRVDLGHGRQAEVLSYNGAYPGPTIDVQEGDHLIVRLKNDLTEATSVHWHGLQVPADQDDATHTVPAGGSRTYEFDIPEGSAGTYWYHPHLHGVVAAQVAKGLFGALRVRPAADPLPGAFGDSVALLSDLRVDASGKAAGPTDGERANGFEGDLVLLNGKPSAALTLRPGEIRRLRLVNAAASRYFRLATPGRKLTLIATDGGYIERPIELDELLLTPGERAELLVQAPTQGSLVLQALPYDRGAMAAAAPAAASPSAAAHAGPGHFRVAQMATDGGHGGMAMGSMASMSPMPTMSPMMSPMPMADHAMSPMPMMGGGTGQGQTLLTIRAQGAAAPAVAIPTSLRSITPLSQAGATVRAVSFSENHANAQFFIDDKGFDASRVDIRTKLGTTEIWSVRNTGHMDHPFHLHGFSFQVVDRAGRAEPFVAWKDTVNIKAGETVRFAVKYDRFAGARVFHCHILDHEDLGMMGVLVVDP